MADSNLINPYEQIWKTRDLRALETPLEVENTIPEWKRGLGAFGKEMQATGYGLLALGSQGLENVVGKNELTSGVTDWGLEGYNKSIEESQSGRNAPSVARIEDIKGANDAMDWASYQLGKGLPMLATLAASGGIGGAVARVGAQQGIKQLAKSAVGDIVKKGVATKAVQAAEGQVVTKAMQEAAAQSLRDTMLKGAMAGGFAGSFGLEGGLAFGEQVAEGVNPADAVKSAIAVGGINGALEFLPFYHVAKKLGAGDYAKKKIADIIANDADLSKKAVALAAAKEIGGRVAKGAAVGAGAEGITEGLQELTSIAGLRWAQEDPLFAALDADDWSRIKNAAATGALVGGVAAGAGATLAGPEVQQRPTVVPPAAPPVDQTRTQVLEAMRDKAERDIEAARATGDTARAEELQRARDLYDTALRRIQGTEQPPITERPPVEQPPVEQPPVPQANDRTRQIVDELKRRQAGEVPPAPFAEEADQIIRREEENLARQAVPPAPAPTTQPVPITPQPFNDLIRQEEEKLADLAQRKASPAPNDDIAQIEQALKDQEELLAQLGQQVPRQETPPTEQKAAVDPWTLSELEFDIKSTPTINLAEKWGQEVADAVANTAPEDMTGTWLTDVAAKAKPQQEGNLAGLIADGQPVPEEYGGKITEDLIKVKGYSPNTVESLVKLAPEGWELSDISKIMDEPPIPFWKQKGGDGNIALSSNQFVWWNENGEAEIFNNYEELTNFLNTQKAPKPAAPTPSGFSLNPGGIKSLLQKDKFKEYSTDTKVYTDDLGETVLLIDDKKGLFGYYGKDPKTGETSKINFNSYNELNDFLNTPKTNPFFNNPAIGEAVQNGKSVTSLTKLAEAFNITAGIPQWEMEYSPTEGMKIKSVKDPSGGPQWELVWDDANDSVKFNKMINGKPVTTELSQLLNISNQDVDALNTVDPWVLAELKADIDFGKTDAELETKWGPEVTETALEYKAGNKTVNSLIKSLIDNPFASFDFVTGKVTTAEQGQLESYAKQGIFPDEFGGTVAQELIEKDGFSPNTVEEWNNLAPPGWALSGVYLHGNQPYPYYSDMANGQGTITIKPGEYNFYHNDGTLETYDTHEKLLEALNDVINPNNFPPPPGNNNNLPPAPSPNSPFAGIYPTYDEIKNLIKSQGNTDAVKDVFKYLPLPSGWKLEGFIVDPSQEVFYILYKNPNSPIVVTIGSGTGFSTYLEGIYTQDTHKQYGTFEELLAELNKPASPFAGQYPTFQEISDLIANGGNSPAVKNVLENLPVPPGWKLTFFDVFTISSPSGPIQTFTITYKNPNSPMVLGVGGGSGVFSTANVNDLNSTKIHNTFESAIYELNNPTSNNPGGTPDSNHSSSSTTPSTPPPVLPGSWAPVESPHGYELNYSTIITPEGTDISLSFNPSQEEFAEISYIHNYLKHAPIPFSEKVKLFKEFPTTKAQLTAFKANHPYLIRKVSIDEATTIDQAKELLNDILMRRDKYSFDEILGGAIKFSEKFGYEELVSALASAPTSTSIGAPVSPSPHLDGWLANMRAEEELLNENPFEGIWADYEVNTGPGSHAARYGVIIINPKTGKVLLRKVANQFEGITWDFARGGADRFGDPNAKPNLIDTNAVSAHPVTDPSKRYMEHPLVAAKREAREEFGYDVKIVGQLAKGFYTSNSGYEGKMASLYYVGVPASEQTDEHLQPTSGTHVKETDETRWVDLHEARRLVAMEPTLPLDPNMKRDGKHKARTARIARTLEAVFNPAMQKSDLDYRSSSKGMEKYFKNGLAAEFPGLLPASTLNKTFDKLTELQKMQVAAALYVSKRFPNADQSTKSNLQKELLKKRKAGLQKWLKDRIGTSKLTDIMEGNTSVSDIQNKLSQTGGKIVLSLWHGTDKTREALLDDVINPIYFGSAWGGHDTKEGMYLTDTKQKAAQWGGKSQVNMLVAFNNLKVIPGTTDYGAHTFASIISTAKSQGYDGVLFDNVTDSVTGRQVVVWNMENITAAGGLSAGFTGSTLYQSKGELGERMDAGTAKVVLENTFGDLAQKMLDSGLLEIVESGGPDGIAGQYFGEEQKIRVYLDYISSPRELLGAVLHEGAHAGMREILGKSAETYYNELLQSNKPIAKYAMYKTAWEGAQRFSIENALTIDNAAEIERVRARLKEIDPNFLIEEDLANFVQQADTTSSLWKRIFNAIKVWWAQSAIGKALKERGIGFELTEEMAVGLVTAAMRTQNIRRGNDYSTYVGHVSGANWSVENNYPYGRPNLKYVLAGGGEGNINYGWGIYVFESLPTYNYYKSTINQGVNNKTYGMHLPDDIPPRMLEWDRELTQQSSIVKDAITSPRDNYLLLRMAVKSKDRKSSYPGDNQLNLEEKGTGGALFNQLRDYFHKLNWNNDYGYKYDPETNKQQYVKNLARRDASRKLAEYGLSGVRLLDAGSRRIKVTRLANGMYSLTRGTNNPQTQTFTEAEFIKHVGPDLAAKVKTYPIGVSKNHAGFGFYNWVFWRQSDLDRFTVVYKNGNQVAGKPNKNAAYDPNGIGIPYAEHPGFADYVINPKTGDKHPTFYSKSDTTLEVDPEELRTNIDSVMGEGWLKQAEEAGLVEVVEGAGPKGESGAWVGDKIRLYAGSMSAGGTPIGVLLHEGKHATFKGVLGNSLNDYVSDLRTLANNGNQAARDAIVRATIAAADLMGIKHGLREGGTRVDLDAVRAAIEELQPGLLAEEELAYFVQYGTESQSGVGFLRRLVNKIKAWFAQTKLGQRLKEMGVGFELTEAMAVEWAKMGLHKSLSNLRQAELTKSRVMNDAAYMSPSARLGNALVAANPNDEFYSMGIEEIKQGLWTDPTDSRLELVNKPGLLQRWRADFVDFFAEIEKKSKAVYETYSLLRSKKAARIEQSRQEYFLPLRELIANSPWTAKEVGDMLAARHIKVDNVNIALAERASDSYVKDLLKALPKQKEKELTAARKNVKAGKMPDGTDYIDVNGNKVDMSSATKRKLMFDLMNKYAPFEMLNPDGKQVLSEEWEIFKDAAGGFSNGGVGKSMVRTVDDVLKLADKDRAKFNEIANLFDAANRHTLDILEDGGLITASEHARLLADKSAYAPLRRESYNVNREIEQLFQKAGQGGSKQIATRSGTANLSEPTLVLQNALAKIEAAAAAAERNLANKELYKVVVADREGWKPWFSIVEKDKYVTHDEDGFLQEKNATASNQADITLINDGKKLVIRPNMHNERAMGFVRAANNLDAQILNGPMKVLSWLNGIVRWVNVSASPVFLMMNAIRDPFTAAYNLQASEAAPYTKEIFQNYGKAFKALKKVFLDGNRDSTDADVQWVERWESAGGRTSFVESLREMDETWRSFDAQVARRQGGLKGIMAAKDKWIDGLENFNILFENVMRFSTFQVLTEKGVVTDNRAAKISQDLTTNFTRRGYKTQALGTWWLFFNATVQGNYQVLRNLLESRRVQAAVGGTIVFALMLDLLGRAIADDWDEIPEWDKERFIILPVKIGGDFIKIPAPWVYNVVWRTGGMLGETLAGVKKPQDAVLDIAAMTMTAFSPLGKPGSIAQAISPTGADPFVQILENKDFAGNPLGPEGFPGAGKKANSELIWNSTPKGYQSFARMVNELTGGSAVESGKLDFRPADYQVLVKFLTGSLGRFMSDATFGMKEAFEKGVEGPKDIPIVKELFSDPYDPMRSQKYHTNIAGIYGAHKLEKMYSEGPDKDLIKLQEVRKERRKELQMYAQAQDVEKQLKSLRIRLRAAQNREDRQRERDIKQKMETVQEQFNVRYQQKVG